MRRLKCAGRLLPFIACDGSIRGHDFVGCLASEKVHSHFHSEVFRASAPDGWIECQRSNNSLLAQSIAKRIRDWDLVQDERVERDCALSNQGDTPVTGLKGKFGVWQAIAADPQNCIVAVD